MPLKIVILYRINIFYKSDLQKHKNIIEYIFIRVQ